MRIDYADHYDSDYFTGQKRFRDAAGVEQKYHGPSLTWDGFELVTDALLTVLPSKPSTLLDIGCGSGDLAYRFAQRGINAYGIDISRYAIDNCAIEMLGKLAVGDITKKPTLPGPGSYELVMATDLLEHIYEEDLEETFTWMVNKSTKWLFFCVATTDAITGKASEFVLQKGAEVPVGWEGMAVAGHVNVRPWQYWVKLFQRHQLNVCWSAMYFFQALREANPGWQHAMGWRLPNVWILRRS